MTSRLREMEAVTELKELRLKVSHKLFHCVFLIAEVERSLLLVNLHLVTYHIWS